MRVQKNSKILKSFLRLICILFFSVISGCSESTFDLSQQSRLPKWFNVPDGMNRKDIKVTLDYYVYPSSREAVFKIYDINNGNQIQKVAAQLEGPEPVNLSHESHEESKKDRPVYEIVSVNGQIDVIEHREKAPVFYFTDDPLVWKKLGLKLER
jgi:hypothetical protein